MARRDDAAQVAAERILADAQLDEPALLHVRVAIAQGERVLCRSGGDGTLPHADVVLGDDGALLFLALPQPCSDAQEVALVRLALALQRTLRPLPPRLLGRAPAQRSRA